MNKSAGRPRGGSDARERILTAARARFVAEGYAASSVRAIARDAGVDHTLVNYHFGSKEGLFGEVMALTRNPADVIVEVLDEAAPEELPRALLATLMRTWENPDYSPPLRAMMLDAAANPELKDLVAGYIEKALIVRLERIVGGRHARQRASAVAMVLAGVVLGRYVFQVPAFARLTREEMLEFYAPAVAAALGPRRAAAHPTSGCAPVG